MGVMHEAVEDSVGEGRIADDLVPGIDRQLAGDQRRTGAITVLDDLHEVAPLVGREPVWAPVIEDQQIGLGKRAEQTREAAVSVSQFETILTDLARRNGVRSGMVYLQVTHGAAMRAHDQGGHASSACMKRIVLRNAVAGSRSRCRCWVVGAGQDIFESDLGPCRWRLDRCSAPSLKPRAYACSASRLCGSSISIARQTFSAAAR